ncbi:MAG: LysR family transcriptional regulator [Clostridia bacterium]|jgi:DNA-binding transcriptional LysR family regulator
MTDKELMLFKTIVDEKSISKAAEKLNMAQPSLSQRLNRIEHGLGIKLFNRTKNGLILTYAGERYYQIAAKILKIFNDFEIEVSEINQLKKGRLTIGINSFLSIHILPVVLPAFLELCPQFEIRVVEKVSTQLERDLAMGELDFAVLHASPAPSDTDDYSSYVNFHTLSRDPFMLVTKKNHPLHTKSLQNTPGEEHWIDLKLFAKEPFILVDRGQRIRQVSDYILQNAGIKPNIAITTKSFESARRLACQGLGVTFVPRQYTEIFPNKLYEGTCYSLSEEYGSVWELGVAIAKDAYISNASKLFIRLLSERFGTKTISL